MNEMQLKSIIAEVLKELNVAEGSKAAETVIAAVKQSAVQETYDGSSITDY